MPPISGSDVALMTSRSGRLRSGAGRSGYYQPMLYITINGVSVQQRLDRGSLTIQQQIDDAPDTAQLIALASTPSTFVPTRGQEIVIALGAADHRLFAGHIINTSVRLPRSSTTKPRIALDCIDYTWELGHRRCSANRWSSRGAGLIAEQIVDDDGNGFTTDIGFGIGPVDFETGPHETIPQALSRLAAAVNAKWYVDPYRVVRFFVGDDTGNNVTLANNQTGVWGLTFEEDMSQVRSRVYVRGAATTTTSAADPGDTTLAVSDTAKFSSSGGTVVVEGNQVTYTGKSVTTGPGTLTGIPASGAGSVTYAITQGAEVRILVVVDASSAQTSLATLFGGDHDGIVGHVIDAPDADVEQAQAIGQADLDAYGVVAEQRVTYQTRSPFVRPGKTITCTITTPVDRSGDFVIQRVTITGFTVGVRGTRPTRFPLRTVEAGTRRREAIDVLQRAEA